MMVPEAYATADEYRTAVTKIDAGSDLEIEMDLLAISRYLDRKLGRIFSRDLDVQRRRFVFGLSCWLPTDDLSEVPTAVYLQGSGTSEGPPGTGGVGVDAELRAYVERVMSGIDPGYPPPPVTGASAHGAPFDTSDGETQTGAGYRLYPSNALLGVEPEPFQGLHFFQPHPRQVVDIVARWGWPAVPMGIMRATIQLAGIWRLETPRATSSVNELNEVVGTSQRANSIIEELIQTYSRKPAFVIA